MRKLLIASALVALLLPSAAGAAHRGSTLSLVGYSVPTAVYPKLISAYQATPQGKGVNFQTSFAASEVQSKAVAAGLPADVVNFSLDPDMDRLVQSGQVAKTWDSNPYQGIVSRSVVVFILRDGNPKHIKTWDDLVKPGVQVVFPNPFSSGGARWDVMAAYGSQLREGKTPKQAQAYLTQLFHHNVSQDTSARNALNTFLSGRGDVLLDYEGDAPDRDAARRGERPEQGCGPAVRQLALHPRRADDLGRERLPLGPARRREALCDDAAGAAAALHDRVARRLEDAEPPVLRPDERNRREDRAGSRSVHWRLTSHGSRGRRAAPSGPRRSAAGSRSAI